MALGLQSWKAAIGALGAMAALLPSMVHAQPAIPSGLVPGGVAVVDGYVFARASAPVRDSLAPLQSLLATRASFYAARWLCQYTPTSDTRLEAPLARVSTVEAKTEGDQLTVTIRLPMQRPDCVVRTLPPSPPPSQEPTDAGASSAYSTLAPYSPPNSVPGPGPIPAPHPAPYSGQTARDTGIN